MLKSGMPDMDSPENLCQLSVKLDDVTQSTQELDNEYTNSFG